MTLRLTGVAVVCALLPAVAASAPVSSTVRVETPAQTVLAPTTVTLEPTDPSVLVTDTTDGDTTTVPAASAFAQLAHATGDAGLILAFQLSDFGAFVNRIGAGTGSGTAFWRFKVNGVLAPVGAADYTIAAGDRVSWSLVTDFDAPELALTVSEDKLRIGESFTVTVARVDNTGARTPASGARVSYGGTAATANAAGAVTFVATASGTRPVQASETPSTGAVRSERVLVCAFNQDPTICDLPPLPGQGDTVAPGTQILVPGPGRVVRRLVRVRGTVSADRSDIAAVELAIARRVTGGCRFVAANGHLGAVRSCAARRWLPARVSGGNWIRTQTRGLPAGRYRLWSRASDGAGNRERVMIPGINATSFSIGAGR